MKSGFCNIFCPNSDPTDFTEAGFDCFSLAFVENKTELASELCFFGSDLESFELALKTAEEKAIPRLVISEDFAFQNESMLLELPKSPIDFAIENKETDTDALMSFFEKTKNSQNRFGLCLNTGHAILAGTEPHELFELFGDKVTSIHANDNHRTGDYHLPPFRGRGGVDWDKFTSSVAKSDYNGALYLDIRAMDHTSKAIFKKSLRVLCLIAKEICEMIENKRDKT